MKELPREPADGLEHDAPWEGPPVALTKLVEPLAAINWIAHGAFVAPSVANPVRQWEQCLPGASDWKHSQEDGRFLLASELVSEAIAAGRLRCVYVVPSEQRSDWETHVVPQAEVVPVAQFAGADVLTIWDQGYGIEVSHGENDSDPLHFDGFYLFWHEVQRMRPARAGSIQPAPGDDGTVVPFPTTPPREVATAQDGQRRGRRARQHGAPIAAFLARCVSFGVERACAEKDEELGRWLMAEYSTRDVEAPHVRNAGADARGALEQWRNSMAQFGANQAG